MTVRFRVRSSVVAVATGALVLAGCSNPPVPPVMPTLPPLAPLPRAVVAGSLEVTQSAAAGQVSYVFAVKLAESGGVPATVTELSISFDNGFGGQCIGLVAKLSQTRVPANSTLALDSLTCDNFNELAFNVEVTVNLTDDNGYKTQVGLRRDKL
jgi:hypothetical protein